MDRKKCPRCDCGSSADNRQPHDDYCSIYAYEALAQQTPQGAVTDAERLPQAGDRPHLLAIKDKVSVEEWAAICAAFAEQDKIIRAYRTQAHTAGGVADAMRTVRWHPKHGFNWKSLDDGPCGDTGTGWIDVPVYAALEAQAPDEWKEAVLNELIVAHIYTKEHDTNPRKAIQDVITWNCQVALDPVVSSDAQALIERGRSQSPATISTPKVEAWLVDGGVEQGLSFDRSSAATMAFANSGTVVALIRESDYYAALQAQAPDVGRLVEHWRHVANEWADAATNSIDAICNVRDGVWSAEDAIANARADIARCRALAAHQGGGEEVCLWLQEDDGGNVYNTGCGYAFGLDGSDDGDINIPHCPWCTKKIKGQAWTADDEGATHD